MKKLFVCSLIFGLLLVASLACATDIEVNLGQEFSLAVGQKVKIVEEDVEIEFLRMVEDSRCPQELACKWGGRVVASVKIEVKGVRETTYLFQNQLKKGMFLYKNYAFVYKNYLINFRIEPYPWESFDEISNDEYRLTMIVSKR